VQIVQAAMPREAIPQDIQYEEKQEQVQPKIFGKKQIG
jgi:hypothetical protein